MYCNVFGCGDVSHRSVFPPTAEANNKAPLKYTEVCIDEVIYLEYNPKSGSVAALSPKYKNNGEIETCSN